MEKNKSNKGVIILLVVIIVILSVLCVLFATQTITLNTKLANDNKQTSEEINDEKTPVINQINYEEIAKEKVPTIISFANQQRGFYKYCGDFADSNNVITKEILSYYLSTKFSTLTELKNYLNNRISVELFNKYFLGENYYVEQDNKLYCQVDAKGTEFIELKNESSINSFGEGGKYTISNQNENTFDVTFEANYTAMGDDIANDVFIAKATFTKINDNWIITKYEDSISKIEG